MDPITFQQFVNNREVVKNLGLNTGTSSSPKFTSMCTTSEVTLTTDFEKQDFFVWCDALKRSIITGAAVAIDTVVKIDMNNLAIQKTLGDIHALIKDGSVAQFNNQLVQFELIESVEEGVLTYKKYQVPVCLEFSDLGGAAEDSGEYSLTINIIGKGQEVSAAA